jgi:hypothetical protein
MEQHSSFRSESVRTITQAVEWLESILPQEELEQIAVMGRRDLSLLHFELGAYVRKQLHLWVGNPELEADAGVADAVAVSAAIIEALWHRLRGPVVSGVPA